MKAKLFLGKLQKMASCPHKNRSLSDQIRGVTYTFLNELVCTLACITQILRQLACAM